MFRKIHDGPLPPQPPKGAKYKLTAGCQTVVLTHEFSPVTTGIADAGVTTIRVLPACDYTFQIRREVSERELGDWGASLTLIDAIMAKHRADLTKGTRVLELGCGLGVPGLVCASLGADVVLTDRADPDDKYHNVLEVLNENVTFNFMGPANHGPGVGCGRAGVVEFTWTEDNARKLVEDHDYFDFVICADPIYQPLYGRYTAPALAACFNILCGPQTECFIALQRRTMDGIDVLLDLLMNKYRFLTTKQTSEFTARSGTAKIEIYTLRRVSEVERFQIDLQSSSTKVGSEDLVAAWRGPLPTKFPSKFCCMDPAVPPPAR